MKTLLMPALFYMLVNMIVVLTFIIAWARNFQETKQFVRLGLTFVVVILATELIMLGIVGPDAIKASALMIILTDLFAAIRIYAFTVVGLLLASRLNERNSELAISSGQDQYSSAYGMPAPSRTAVLVALTAVVFMLVFTIVLFKLTNVNVGQAFQGKENPGVDVSYVGVSLVAIFGFAEEVIFRLGILTALTYLWRSAASGHHWAIAVTTALWCVGHLGTLDPEWVKMVQIAIFGLILGYMYRRYGLVPCIITHVLFNILMALISPWAFGHMLGSA